MPLVSGRLRLTPATRCDELPLSLSALCCTERVPLQEGRFRTEVELWMPAPLLPYKANTLEIASPPEYPG